MTSHATDGVPAAQDVAVAKIMGSSGFSVGGFPQKMPLEEKSLKG